MLPSPSDRHPNALLLTVPTQIPSNGGTLRAEPYGVAVTVPPGALVRQTALTLTISAKQFPTVARSDYVLSTHGVTLTLDTTALSRQPQIEVQLSMPAHFDPERTLLCISDAAALTAAVPVQPSADGQHIVGSIPTWYLLHHRSKAVQRGSTTTLLLYTATKALAAPPIVVTSVQEFQVSTGTWTAVTSNLANMRVAILVHGILSSLDDLTVLATDLAMYTRPGDTTPYYDAVIGFQYTSNAPLSVIGTDMTDAVGPLIGTAQTADIFAHSMGNLVSRWAMEIGDRSSSTRLRAIAHYVSLSGPHAGVPFADSSLLMTFLYLFPLACEPCLNDLLTYGDNGSPLTEFLPLLNGPTSVTDTRYYTISGTVWQDYDYGVGVVTQALYIETSPWDWNFWIEDGLVAQFSAQSPVLTAKDPYWQEGAALNLNHHQLTDTVQAIDSIFALISEW